MDSDPMKREWIWSLDTPSSPGLYWIKDLSERRMFLVDVYEADSELRLQVITERESRNLRDFSNENVGRIVWGPRDGAVRVELPVD